MCRHIGYLGPARTIASVLEGGEHSLLEQSWAPRDMRGGGTVNADGYGAAWWADMQDGQGAQDRQGVQDGRGELGRYRSAAPIWSDPALGPHGVLRHVRSAAVVAAVRSATVGMPTMAQACAPFTDGHWAFSHNGVVRGWPATMAQLADELEPADAITLDAPTDSALLWALLRGSLTTEEPAEAIRALILDVEAVAPGSRLNLLLGDGQSMFATAWDHALWWRCGDGEVWFASEPVDARPGWTQVPDRHLVIATLDGVRTEKIGGL